MGYMESRKNHPNFLKPFGPLYRVAFAREIPAESLGSQAYRPYPPSSEYTVPQEIARPQFLCSMIENSVGSGISWKGVWHIYWVS